MTIFSVYFLFFIPLLIVTSAFGQTIPDYDDPYSPIFTDKSVYTWTDKVKMTIVAPSWNSDRYLIDSIGDTQTHPIKISTREHSLEPYRFTETDVNSGVFTAEVILTGFSHDADGDGDIDTSPRTFGNGPTNGFLEVDRNSAVTISFEFADGVILTKSVPVQWNLGDVRFLNEINFLKNPVSIQVFDLDMNLNPEALDQIILEVYSDSDSAGIQTNAVETSESSGSFVATVYLSQNSPSSGNRLYAVPGDQIFAKYNDHTLPKPYSTSDNLLIESFSKVDSSIPPIQRLENLPTFFSDSLGNQLDSFSENNQVQIVGSVSNALDFKQTFVYLFQIKNANNSIESLSWIQGELNPQQSLDVSQSWIPKKSGMYKIETFVWNSLGDPIALAPSNSKSITVD